MKRILISFLAFLAIVSAGPITLQTTCNFTNSTTTLSFIIRNIGNDTAYHISITPIFEGKEYESIGRESLIPGGSISFDLPLRLNKTGDYISILSISYTDLNGVPAYTLAHCGFTYNLPSTPLILLSLPNLTFIDSKHYRLDLNITNLARFPINSTLNLILPLSFFANKSNFSFSLSPSESKHFSTTIEYKGIVQGIFEGVAYTSFSLNNVHYTSFVSFPISTQQQASSPLAISNLLLIALASMLILIVVFVIFRLKRVVK